MAPQPPGYFDRVNPDLLAAIPRDAGHVLEIGCGSGALGHAFRQVSPAVDYTGVELDPDAAEAATTRLDQVLQGDIEKGDILDRLAGRRFDTFVFGDVLEHLVDPWSLLRRLRELAAPGATAVACIPNVQHWSVLRPLLAGRWDYADEGLLDRTHLRFFTFDGCVALFRDTGWQPLDVVARRFATEEGQRFVEALRPALPALGVDAEQFAKTVLAVQFVVRAQAIPAAPP